MVEVIWHGRGGQGVVIAAQILAESAYLQGFKGVTSAPTFGPERRGAPLTASTRISDTVDPDLFADRKGRHRRCPRSVPLRRGQHPRLAETEWVAHCQYNEKTGGTGHPGRFQYRHGGRGGHRAEVSTCSRRGRRSSTPRCSGFFRRHQSLSTSSTWRRGSSGNSPARRLRQTSPLSRQPTKRQASRSGIKHKRLI